MDKTEKERMQDAAVELDAASTGLWEIADSNSKQYERLLQAIGGALFLMRSASSGVQR